MSDKNDKKVETTGHVWDEDLKELNNPLPRWWVWIFYATVVFAIVYTILYPAWPLTHKATQGLLGYTYREALQKDMERFKKMNAPLEAELVSTDLTQVKPGTPLYSFAMNAGRSTFLTFCSQCHGSNAAGAKGFPNLLDDDWLHGGTINEIYTTIKHGVRDPKDPDTLDPGPMPAWKGVLSPKEIDEVVQYVLQISGQKADPTLAKAGKTVFADNCAACHGENGKGMKETGAPNLTDSIWLYGGDPVTLAQTIENGRVGVMPSWNNKLPDWQIRAVALYVHGLGGGQ